MSNCRKHCRGNAITETAIFLVVFVFIIAGLLRLAVSLISYYNLVAVSREGARIAATTPLLMMDDSRVKSAVVNMIMMKSLYSDITVSNTVPMIRSTVLNRDGLNCGRDVGVSVALTVSFPFGSLFGSDNLRFTRTTYMRYLHQPLCT